MKLTTEKLKNMIREALSEAHSDDFDMGAHVHHKRMGRMRRGEPDPRNIPAGSGGADITPKAPEIQLSVVKQMVDMFGPSSIALNPQMEMDLSATEEGAALLASIKAAKGTA